MATRRQRRYMPEYQQSQPARATGSTGAQPFPEQKLSDPRRLTRKERKRFKQMRKTDGEAAAQEWRQQQRLTQKPLTRKQKKKLGNIQRPQGAVYQQNMQNANEMQQQAMLNRPQEFNPFGSREYYFDENGNLVQNDSLSAPQQMLLEQRQDTDYGSGEMAQNYLDQIQANGQWNPQNLPDMPGAGGFDAERQRIEDEMYKREASLIDERFGKEQQQMEQALADRGIPMGSELYNKEMQDFTRRREDAHSAARQQAVGYAGSEQQSRFQMGMGARNQALGEYGQGYQMPFQGMQSMLGSQAGIQMPNFNGFQAVQVPHFDQASLGLGFAGQQTQKDITQMNLSGRGGGGGGGLGYDPFALSAQEHQQQMELAGYNNYLNQQNQPKSPSTSSQIGGALIGLGGAALGGWAAGGWK